jgi:hypothetical protein
MERSRGDTAFTLMGGILALLLVVGAMLFLVLVRTPAGRAAAGVSEAKAITCPVGSHAPVCYQFVLTNVGAAPGQFGCRAHPADGASAVFDIGASTYVVPVDGPLPVGKDVTLTVLSESLNGSDVVGVPQVGCDPVP